jgi:hypothetical protein
MARRFWPFESRYAWWASAVLLPAAIGIAVVLQTLDVLPGPQMAWWVLLGAVIIGMLPILLLVLGGVSAVKAAGVEVAFAARSRRSAQPTRQPCDPRCLTTSAHRLASCLTHPATRSSRRSGMPSRTMSSLSALATGTSGGTLVCCC